MPLSIFSNVASSDTQVRLGRTQDAIAKNMAHLSSGLRIASASDDPAGLGVSVAFDSQVRSYQQAARNTNDGVSMLQTVDGALGQVHSILERMRELAVQSSNGTLATADRANLQTEFAQLQTEITRIATSTNFGSVALLSATTTVTLQVGANNTANDQIAVTVTQSDAGTLAVAAIKVDTQTGANASMNAIDTAIATVSSNRALMGAAQNRLKVALDNDNVFAQNLGAAVSRIRDVDVAAESAALARNNVLQQAGVAVLAQANQQPQLALSLLR